MSNKIYDDVYSSLDMFCPGEPVPIFFGRHDIGRKEGCGIVPKLRRYLMFL
jgi:hypothetical protein